MQAIEDIAIGEDLTPAIRPIAAVLGGAAISSHCSACFCSLPPQPFAPNVPKGYGYAPTATPTPLYCSLNCSSLDSPLHCSSAELHLLSLLAHPPPTLSEYSSELRLSLRVIHIFQNSPQESSVLAQRSFLGGKISSFFQGNEKIEVSNDSIGDREKKFEKMEVPNDSIGDGEKGFENLERVMDLMTNRENLVFGGIKKNPFECDEDDENLFMMIKEGAKMMAKARQMCVDVDEHEGFDLEEMVLCLVLTNATEVQINGVSLGIALYDTTFSWINHSCSPNSCYRFLVGTDNSEQKHLRIAPINCDGLIRYQFSEIGYGPRLVLRSIKDVSKGEEVTITYIDLLLPKKSRQAELWSKYRFICSCNCCDASPITYLDHALQVCYVDNTEQIENLIDKFEGVMNDFLSLGNPESCCQNLENLLLNSECKPRLHPSHHVSLNAFITLTFAYKSHASDLVAQEGYTPQAFNLYKTSCAYSLLVACVGSHLFAYEPALVTSVANYWMDVGKLLLELSRSFLWDESLFNLSLQSPKCDGCGFLNERRELHNCIANLTPRIWRLLCCGSVFLKNFGSPLDFNWLESDGDVEILEGRELDDKMRRNLMMLGIHCLRFGAVLSSICYGLSVEMNYNRALMQISD